MDCVLLSFYVLCVYSETDSAFEKVNKKKGSEYKEVTRQSVNGSSIKNGEWKEMKRSRLRVACVHIDRSKKDGITNEYTALFVVMQTSLFHTFDHARWFLSQSINAVMPPNSNESTKRKQSGIDKYLQFHVSDRKDGRRPVNDTILPSFRVSNESIVRKNNRLVPATFLGQSTQQFRLPRPSGKKQENFSLFFIYLPIGAVQFDEIK